MGTRWHHFHETNRKKDLKANASEKKEKKTMVEVEQRLESSFADFVYVSWSRDGTVL